MSALSPPDLLSEVLATLRLRCGLYFPAELRGETAVEVPAERRRIRFHLVRRGRCWLLVDDAAPIALEEGDAAMIPNGAAQILATAPEAAATPLPELMARGALSDGVLRAGSGAPAATLLCGFAGFDEAVEHPALAGLPPSLVVRRRDLGAEPWAEATLRLLSLEAELSAQGGAGVLARLLEILLIQTLRRMTGDAQEGANGFVAALADARLSRALQAIHAAPEQPWTVEALARLAGMSRARFAARFATVLGAPPAAYLTRWRLARARGLLAETGLDMTEIAERCGYASVPSFSSRFKRAFGVGPGGFRREARGN